MMALAHVPLLLAATLAWDAQPEWRPAPASSGMRLAQWELAGESGLPSAEVVIFHFGEGSGGSAEANLERWFGQFEQPDGAPTRERASVTRFEVGELEVTRADISGTYVAAVRPGSPQRHRRPDHRMVAAVVEGDGGPWFVRLLGPGATVARWSESFDRFVRSFRSE